MGSYTCNTAEIRADTTVDSDHGLQPLAAGRRGRILAGVGVGLYLYRTPLGLARNILSHRPHKMKRQYGDRSAGGSKMNNQENGPWRQEVDWQGQKEPYT